MGGGGGGGGGGTGFPAGQGSQGLLPRGERADSHGAPEWDQGGHTH